MRSKQNTIKELRKICQDTGPSKQTQSYFGRSIRWVSIYFTKVFISLGAYPNHITVAGTAIYLIGIGLIATGTFLNGLVGFGLLVLSTVFDACDGELFRFRGYREGYGFYVEPTTHDIMYGLQFALIGYGGFIQIGQLWIFIFGVAGSIFKLLFRLHEVRFFFNVTEKLPQQDYVDVTGKFSEQSSLTRIIYFLYRNSATSTGILLPLLIAIVFQRLDLFVILYGTGYFLLWVGLLVRQIRRFRRIIEQVYNYHDHINNLKLRLQHKKVIVFDLDGTLLDTMGVFTEIASYLIAWKYGTDRSWARSAYVRTSGIPFFQQLDKLFPGHEHNQAVADLFEQRKIAATDHFEMSPEDKSVIERLVKNGYRVIVSSNNFQENVQHFAGLSGIAFPQVLGYSDGFAKGKPHFDHIIENQSVAKEEMLFIGDSLSDMRVAQTYGIDFIGKVGTFSREEFEAASPMAVTIRSFQELNDMLPHQI